MSAKTREALERALKSVEVNAPHVNAKLSEGGTKPSEVFVYSVAKYYEALNKLAKE